MIYLLTKIPPMNGQWRTAACLARANHRQHGFNAAL
jgi:hypothetical protein